ncbi:MAG: hypothetical protein Q8O67_17770 [Deltaproteobacteria bacterium]|nr:hypothetical protein [Deltaproteobacteria bacterium]
MLALSFLALVSLSAPGDEVSAAIGAYHAGEQQSSVAVVVAGGVSVVGGGALLFVDDAFARGLGASLAVVGALGAAGFGFYLWIIPGLVADLEQRASVDRTMLAREERLRLERVIDRFVWLRVIEGGLVVGAMVAAGIGAGTDNDVVTGVGVGVAAGALGLFVYDSLAADRARVYRATYE